MTKFNETFLAKATTAVVAVAAGVFMLGGAAIAPAYAQSNSELEAQIQSLLETIASLQAQVGGDASVGGSFSNCPTVWLTDLGQGSTGQSVMDLQVFLNQDADTQVAVSGVGSPGNETSYYGSLTAQAVSDFQAKYSADILAPLGLSAPTGYWGASSRDKARNLCASQPDDSDDMDDDDSDDDSMDDDDDSDDDSDDDNDELDGGEASLEDFDLRSGDDSDVSEGESADIAEIEFDVENGDVRLGRIDLTFESDSGNDEDEPWDAFEEIAIMHDGDEIASEDVSDEDDWLEEDEPYEFRMSGLDTIIREGDSAELTVVITAQNGVDGADDGNADWTIYVQDEGVRAQDGEGIEQYTGDDSDTIDFEIEEEGSDDEFDVNSSSDDPDASTIEVDEDDTTGWFDIFVFELDASDSDSDIEIDQLPIEIDISQDNSTSSTVTINDVINDLELTIDGETFDDYEIDDETSTNTAIVTFDIDDEYTLEAGEEVDVALGVEFQERDGNYTNGQQIRARVDSDDDDNEDDLDITGDGADDVVADGSARGEWHTLLAEGIFAFDATTDADTSGDNDTTGVFEFRFTVDAFDDDFYIARDGSSNDQPDDDAGFEYEVDGDGTGASSSDISTNLRVPGADRETLGTTEYYRINEGESEDVRFTVSVDPAAGNSGLYSVSLDTLEYFDDQEDSTIYDFTPAEDYETDSVQINN